MQPFWKPRQIETVWWEVHYSDGTSISEAKGASYGNIHRDHLSSFLLRSRGGPIVELTAEDGRSGRNLVYRRRTALIGGNVKVIFILGWVPQGPILAVDMADEKVYQVKSFVSDDPIFYPPSPRPDQGERWIMPNAARIINPAHERTD